MKRIRLTLVPTSPLLINDNNCVFLATKLGGTSDRPKSRCYLSPTKHVTLSTLFLWFVSSYMYITHYIYSLPFMAIGFTFTLPLIGRPHIYWWWAAVNRVYGLIRIFILLSTYHSVVFLARPVDAEAC